ncbi:MAG: hypothetical protein IT319_21335, partial [Anaerolineae bacterium]|nr:hypothetical protein [Anaerolineae bacterium]
MDDWQLQILGLIPGTAGTCTFSQPDLRLSFISDEDTNNSSCVFGRLTLLSDAEMEIAKTTTATVLTPGDFVDYQIDYNCASITDNCVGVQIIDFLPDELSYAGSTGSTHTTTSEGVYSSSSNTVTFNFINPL